MTRYFYDTEFLEDGKTIDLISIGIVADDGREFYAVDDEVVSGPLHDRILKHSWLMQNVVPHLPLKKIRNERPWDYFPPGSTGRSFFRVDLNDNRIMPRRMIRNAVRDFLLVSEPDVELWADYAAYDHVALCQLFGRMIDLPEGVPMFTHDFQQALRAAGNPPMPEQENGLHNALEDARHLKVCFSELQKWS